MSETPFGQPGLTYACCPFDAMMDVPAAAKRLAEGRQAMTAHEIAV
jgi:hypothetical protein